MESLTELLDRVDAYCEKVTSGGAISGGDWHNFQQGAVRDLPRLSAALKEMMGHNDPRVLTGALDKIIELTNRVTELEAALKRAHGAITVLPDDALGQDPLHGHYYKDELLAEIRAALAATEKE